MMLSRPATKLCNVLIQCSQIHVDSGMLLQHRASKKRSEAENSVSGHSEEKQTQCFMVVTRPKIN